jgi:hypothetical protein
MRFTRVLIVAALGALIIAPAALALRFSDSSLLPPSGVEGQFYSHKLDGAGGCNENDYEFRVVGGTSLPPGLRLVGTSTDWRIEGVPLVAGDFPVGLQMWSDGNADCAIEETPPNTRRTAERDITIRIARGLKIEQTQANVPPATVGQAYGPIQLTASGGGTQSWSAVQAPTGIGVSSTGVVSGTPTTKSGDTKLIVKVTDGSRSNQVTYNLPVRDKLELTVPPAPRTEVGRPYTLRATAAGGNEAYTREIAGLPTGLVFDVNTGAISCSPTVAGSFPVKMTLKDTEGRVATQDFLITVAPKLAFVTKKLKSGKVGKAYSATFRLKGGVGPIEWRLIRFRPGAKGVKLDKLTGTLRFTPGVARTYTIIVRATDSLKVRAEQTVTVTVK